MSKKKKVKPCSPISAPSYYRRTQVKDLAEQMRESQLICNDVMNTCNRVDHILRRGW